MQACCSMRKKSHMRPSKQGNTDRLSFPLGFTIEKDETAKSRARIQSVLNLTIKQELGKVLSKAIAFESALLVKRWVRDSSNWTSTRSRLECYQYLRCIYSKFCNTQTCYFVLGVLIGSHHRAAQQTPSPHHKFPNGIRQLLEHHDYPRAPTHHILPRDWRIG